MITKNSLIFLFCFVFLSSLVIAQEYKLEISIIPEDKIFEPGETIQLKVIIYDANNNPVQDDVLLVLKNIKEKIIKETTIKSNNFEQIELPEDILAGKGEIIVKYYDTEIIETFAISKNKLIDIKIEGEKLILTNIGNTVYNEGIYITIGRTIGTKTPKLNIGESISYRLVAPEGVYKIEVTDENRKTLFIKSEVKLTGIGTGNVIGALDESQRTGITGGVRPEDSEQNIFSYFEESKFIYVFVFIILGAMILLAIERRYRKKLTAKK